MKRTEDTQAELHVLDRIMHLLEENSVSHLAAKDRDFADFVGKIYGDIHGQANQLRQP